jgi:hypothetical protein
MDGLNFHLNTENVCRRFLQNISINLRYKVSIPEDYILKNDGCAKPEDLCYTYMLHGVLMLGAE